MTMQIPLTSFEIKRHLQNNVLDIRPQTIDKIVEICNLVNMGEMCLDDEIEEGSGLYISDMLKELHIEYID